MRSFSGIATLLGLAAAIGLAGCSTPGQKPAPQASQGLYKVGSAYQVDGIWYYPHQDLNYDETGIASWYGEAFAGRRTANGEVFDLNGLTAAHHTLALPSIVEVTNLENGRTLTLRVNDRGPFARGRIIDVSRHAAQLLGFELQGTAKVRVRVLMPETMEAQAAARHNGVDEPQAAPVMIAQAAPRTAVDTEPLTPLPGSSVAPPPPPGPVITHAPSPSSLTAVPTGPILTGTVTVKPAHPGAQIYVQAGAFAQLANANRVRDRIASLGSTQVSGIRVNGANLFRVRLGPVANVGEADRLLGGVLAAGYSDAKIVVE
jgi:rare lipoprotein A